MPAAVRPAKSLHILPQAPRKRKKALPLTTHERRLQKARRKEKASSVHTDILNWYTATEALAEEMSAKYGKRPRYYLSLLCRFIGQSPSVRAINSFNAWASNMAEKLNAGECSLFRLHRDTDSLWTRP